MLQKKRKHRHTPGPWVAVGTQIRHFAGEEDTAGELVAEVPLDDDGTWVFNATLLAAAPRLLSALRAMLNMPRWDKTLPPRELQQIAKERARIKQEAKLAVARALPTREDLRAQETRP